MWSKDSSIDAKYFKCPASETVGLIRDTDGLIRDRGLKREGSDTKNIQYTV